MEQRKSFIMYTETENTISFLSYEEAGRIFKSIFEYIRTGDPPCFEDRSLNIAFQSIRDKLDAGTEKWERICERNRNNGRLGGRPRKQQDQTEDQQEKAVGFVNNPNNPLGFLETQENPNNPTKPNETQKTL